MITKPPPSLDFPRPPIDGSESVEMVFALAADHYAAITQTDTGEWRLHDAPTRELDLGPRRGGKRLQELVDSARGAPVPLGHYDILRCIGAGGMGVVYEATNREHNLRVALKTLQLFNAPSLYRFKNEFRSVQSILHPNLCALYELVTFEDDWFFTMEYVDGVSFVEYVRDAKRDDALGFDEARLRACMRQLAAGVAALHEAKKLHRDLNAANVLVTHGGRVVILDFGLISNDPRGGREAGSFDGLSGTPGYMAPEQCSGQIVSTASDWYAVGVMLYEALTGRLPFLGTIRQVLIAKCTMDPLPPQRLCPAVPDDLNALCLALLRRAPSERPSFEDVLRCLDGAPLPPSKSPSEGAPPSAESAFVGREAQLSALRVAFEAVFPGKPVSVHVHGPSGIGKSALVHHFLATLGSVGGGLVLKGRCYERESVPYKAFDSLIDAITRHLRSLPEDDAAALLPQDFHALARVFPVLGGVPSASRVPQPHVEARDPQESRRRAFSGLKELLRRLAAKGPLVLYIDDLQWGDLDSGRLFSFLLSPPDPPGLLLITTYRSDATHTLPLPKDLSPGSLGIRDILVEPLSLHDAVELALCRMGRRDESAGELAQGIAGEADGSPFLVEELSRYAQRVSFDGGLSISLEQLVQARIGGLSKEAQTLLEVIAVAGRPIAQRLVFSAASLGPAAPAALLQLSVGRFIRAQGFRDADRVESYHDRIREAVVAKLSPEALRRHHLRLAEALSRERAPDPEELASHFMGAAELERAATYTEAAAARAEAALAFDRAADLYRDALRLRKLPPSGERPLRLKRALALVNAGRGAEAAPIYLASAADGDAKEAIDLQRRAAEQFLLTGHVGEGVRTLRPILDAHGLRYPETPRRALFSFVLRLAKLRLRGTRFRERPERQIDPALRSRISAFWSAGRGLASADPMRSGLYLVEALLLALDAGDVHHIVPGLAFVGCISVYEGTSRAVEHGTELITQADRLAARSEDPYLKGFTASARGLAHLCVGEWRKALTWMDESQKIFRDQCVGATWERNIARSVSLQALLALGEIKERHGHAQAWLREAKAIGDIHASVDAAMYVALGRLAGGDPSGAREEVRAAIGRWSSGGFSFQHQTALVMETFCDLYEGRPHEAVARVHEAFPALEKSHLLRVQLSRIEALTLRAHSALALARKDGRERSRMLRVAEADAARLEREGRLHATATAALIRAGIARESHKPLLASKELRRAASLYDAAEMKLHAACARRHLGEIAAADAALQEQGIREPARWARMYSGMEE